MAKTKMEADPDQPDEQLDRAIEELRGVLKEEERRPDAALRAASGANSSIIMAIPVDVQIILGSTE
ncbi:flagellar motor switch protein FliN, partial [Mesorhizobium sp. M4B.F.Ca.ET.088.02.2.1]